MGVNGTAGLKAGVWDSVPAGGNKAEVLLKATKVDGVYTSDPELDPDATFLPEVRYLEALERGLKVMDTTAISLCMDNDLPIIVFSIRERGNLLKLLKGERVGSLVHGA